MIIDFRAEWCGPCPPSRGRLRAGLGQDGAIVFAKIDTEAQRELAQACEITSIPTPMIVREQITIFRQPGTVPRGSTRRPHSSRAQPRHGHIARCRHPSSQGRGAGGVRIGLRRSVPRLP
ncbi:MULTISPECIES: thioredoxin family protein [unclassified Streptomyces]|uniref:thioredoxin family protein n=1 Tax=unclassified Streptomyces TaxID=2593676 RepID=UPI0028A8867F|nr:thioredoxin domain-containing protein [Streptomyces sp. WAC 01420]